MGFALNFQNEYVVEAAIEPGIKGIADTLTNFSILITDETGNWQNVTSEFYYGVPYGCDWLSENGITGTHPGAAGNRNCRWCFSLPDNPMPKVDIQTFVSNFNQIGPDKAYDRHAFPKTGLDVTNADFTFWAKPDFAKKFTDLYLQVTIETASGKKWQQQIHHSNKQESLDSNPPNH